MYQNTTDMATAAATTTRSATQWSREDQKIFERALLMVPENSPNRWEEIAEKVPGMSAAEVRDYYQDLVHDILEIESGQVEIPIYPDDLAESGGSGSSDSGSGGSGSSDWKTRPWTWTWTEEEQRLFLAEFENIENRDWINKHLKIFS